MMTKKIFLCFALIGVLTLLASVSKVNADTPTNAVVPANAASTTDTTTQANSSSSPAADTSTIENESL